MYATRNKPKIFTIWPFTEFANPCLKNEFLPLEFKIQNNF